VLQDPIGEFAMTSAAPSEIPDCPPLSPEGERVVDDDPAFTSECIDRLNKATPPDYRPIQIGRPLTTRTAKWGLVWRVDFTQSQMKSTLVHRVVCWRASGGEGILMQLALFQSLAPLHAPD
jgi:hypothetical protein